MKKTLPIGNDSFRRIREDDSYYADKTLLIQDFIRSNDIVSLVTRPRRFGKTLNITMLREFFDITMDGCDIFKGLAIMDTEYASQINSRPVIYITFKDCKAATAESLLFLISDVVLKEYQKYYTILKEAPETNDSRYVTFFMTYNKLLRRDIDINLLQISIETLERVLYAFYKTKVIVLIDEYDQPIMSGIEYGYHDILQPFFTCLYGTALKGSDCLHQAMLTGIQRVVKESIFSQLNNVRVYTAVDKKYSAYFGFTEDETSKLLSYYDLSLNEPVKLKYNGYIFGDREMYNPWSIINYADTGQLNNYWINTSTNYLVKKSISESGDFFRNDFDKLIAEGVAIVSADLSCSFQELEHASTLWGLLINAGYMTVIELVDELFYKVRIPNGEVRSEFIKIIADIAMVQSRDLFIMFHSLMKKDIEGFLKVYRELVISCTSYHDAKENAYHMLFLGMCITLNNLYKITSNIESGYGRYDIRMESLSPEKPHIIIEFKQGEAIDVLKEEALQQILTNRYYDGLQGEVLCLGIAHDKKRCGVAYKLLS